MKVALVYPMGGDIKQGMPLAFAYLKSNTDADIEVIDCTLDKIERDEFLNRIRQINPEVVGITSWSVNSPEALMILRAAKQANPDIITIYGGPHATILADKLIRNEEVDFVFRGEAELSFQIFLDELGKTNPDFSKVKGLIYKNGGNGIARIENPDNIKFPDYDSINLERYIEKGYCYQNSQKRNAPIWVTRGCPYRCNFCAVPSISGNELRRHSIEYIMRWIQILYAEHNIRGFVIIDDNFTFDIEYAKAFCREVIRLGYKDIEFNCPNGIRMQRGNSELWNLMYKAGWRTLAIAPESGSKRVLQSLKKALDPEEVFPIVEDIKRAGLKINGFFMMGCPEETLEDLKATEALIRKCKFDKLSVTMFQPMPGAPLYDDLIRRGEIADDFLPGPFNTRTYIPPALKDFDYRAFVAHMVLMMYSDQEADLTESEVRNGV